MQARRREEEEALEQAEVEAYEAAETSNKIERTPEEELAFYRQMRVCLLKAYALRTGGGMVRPHPRLEETRQLLSSLTPEDVVRWDIRLAPLVVALDGGHLVRELGDRGRVEKVSQLQLLIKPPPMPPKKEQPRQLPRPVVEPRNWRADVLSMGLAGPAQLADILEKPRHLISEKLDNGPNPLQVLVAQTLGHPVQAYWPTQYTSRGLPLYPDMGGWVPKTTERPGPGYRWARCTAHKRYQMDEMCEQAGVRLTEVAQCLGSTALVLRGMYLRQKGHLELRLAWAEFFEVPPWQIWPGYFGRWIEC